MNDAETLPATTAAELLPARIQPAADRNPAAVYLARLAPGSRPAQKRALDRLAAELTSGRADALSLPWAELRYQHAAALRVRLADLLAPATVNRHLSALRGVMREAWRLGLIDAETCERVRDVRNIKAERLPTGRHIEQAELRGLFDSCAGDGASGARDAALLSVLYAAGLRRAEAVALDLADLNAETGALRVRHGKRNRERLCWLRNGALSAVRAWLELRGEAAGPLFAPVNRGGKVQPGRGMTAGAVNQLLARRAIRAAVAPFTAHDLRRTFAGDMLTAGADLVHVQKLMGHASPTTTAAYDRRADAERCAAAERLHVPYTRPAGPRPAGRNEARGCPTTE
jgi:site-specific recombinase XerD